MCSANASRQKRFRERKDAEQEQQAAELQEAQQNLRNSELERQNLEKEVVRLQRECDVLRMDQRNQMSLIDDWRNLAARPMSTATTTTAVRAAQRTALDAHEIAIRATIASEMSALYAEMLLDEVHEHREQVQILSRRESELAEQRDEARHAADSVRLMLFDRWHAVLTPRLQAVKQLADYKSKFLVPRHRSSPSAAKRNALRKAQRRETANELRSQRQMSEETLGRQAIEQFHDDALAQAYEDGGQASYSRPATLLLSLFTLIASGKTRRQAIEAVAEQHAVSMPTLYKYCSHFYDTGTIFAPHEKIGSKNLCPLLEASAVEELHRTMRQWRAEKKFVTLDVIAKEVNECILCELVQERAAMFSPSTILRWLHVAGYRYKARVKTIFIDNHERVDVVEDRTRFIDALGQLYKRMRLYTTTGTPLFALTSEAMAIESLQCSNAYIDACHQWGQAWFDWCTNAANQSVPVAPEFLTRNQFMHVVEASKLVHAASLDEFLKVNFFARDVESVPSGCVAASFNAETQRVVVIINQDETIVRCKNFWGFAWTNEVQGVVHNKEKNDGAGEMLSLMMEYGGRGNLFGLSRIELAEYRVREASSAAHAVTVANQLVAELQSQLAQAKQHQDEQAIRQGRSARVMAQGEQRRTAKSTAKTKRVNEVPEESGRGKRSRTIPSHLDDFALEASRRTDDNDVDDIDNDLVARRQAANTHTMRRDVDASPVAQLEARVANAQRDVVAANTRHQHATEKARVARLRAYDGTQATPTPTPQRVVGRVINFDNDNMMAHLTLRYGKDNGYFDCDLMCQQMEHAMIIARTKYGTSVDVHFLIDHSANHFAMASDGLNAYAMNKRDNTETQPIMRDTTFVDHNGVTRTQKIGQRGLVSILTERGVDVVGKNLDALRDLMAEQSDFRVQRSRIEELATTHNVSILRGVKFHPELMPIEQLNGAMKRVVRNNLTGSIVGLAEQCIDVLRALDVALPMRFSRKSFVTLEAYASNDWSRLNAVLDERKRRRRGTGVASLAPSRAGSASASQQSVVQLATPPAMHAFDDVDARRAISEDDNDDVNADDAQLMIDDGEDE